MKIGVRIENMTLIIDVTDTGIGIQEEDKDKLFKIFGFLQDKK